MIHIIVDVNTISLKSNSAKTLWTLDEPDTDT